MRYLTSTFRTASPWPLPLLVNRGPISDWLLGLHQKLLWNVRGDNLFNKSRVPSRTARTARSFANALPAPAALPAAASSAGAAAVGEQPTKERG